MQPSSVTKYLKLEYVYKYFGGLCGCDDTLSAGVLCSGL